MLTEEQMRSKRLSEFQQYEIKVVKSLDAVRNSVALNVQK